MKTVSTKLDKQTFEKFQEMCNYEGQCMSEEIRDMIRMGIDAYEEGLEMEKEQESISNPSRPKLKNVRISYDDGKNWIEVKKKI